MASNHQDADSIDGLDLALALGPGSPEARALIDKQSRLIDAQEILARADLMSRRGPEHLGLLVALLEACAFCDDPANHAEVVELLADRRYLGLPAEVVRRGFPGDEGFDHGHGQRAPAPDFMVFHRDDANTPSADKSAWIARHLLDGAAKAAFTPAQLAKIFRTDLHTQARALRAASLNHDPETETRLLSA